MCRFFLCIGKIKILQDHCNISKKAGFTFKSRFCVSFGKVYTDNQIDNMLGNCKFYESKNFLKNLKNIKINLIYEDIVLKWNQVLKQKTKFLIK